jgi:hypothetical protein
MICTGVQRRKDLTLGRTIATKRYKVTQSLRKNYAADDFGMTNPPF